MIRTFVGVFETLINIGAIEKETIDYKVFGLTPDEYVDEIKNTPEIAPNYDLPPFTKGPRAPDEIAYRHRLFLVNFRLDRNKV